MKITRDELKKRGWKTVDLIGRNSEILRKGSQQITWNAETQEIIEGSLDEEGAEGEGNEGG